MATIEMIMDLAFIAFAVYGIFVLRKWRKCTDQVEEIEGTDCSRGCVIIRLIDADKSDEIIVFDKQNELLQCSAVRDYCKRQREFLNKFPTVDAEPVVRCMDCRSYKYFDDGEHGYRGYCLRTICVENRKENDFCSYGERKGGE